MRFHCFHYGFMVVPHIRWWYLCDFFFSSRIHKNAALNWKTINVCTGTMTKNTHKTLIFRFHASVSLQSAFCSLSFPLSPCLSICCCFCSGSDHGWIQIWSPDKKKQMKKHWIHTYRFILSFIKNIFHCWFELMPPQYDFRLHYVERKKSLEMKGRKRRNVCLFKRKLWAKERKKNWNECKALIVIFIVISAMHLLFILGIPVSLVRLFLSFVRSFVRPSQSTHFWLLPPSKSLLCSIPNANYFHKDHTNLSYWQWFLPSHLFFFSIFIFASISFPGSFDFLKTVWRNAAKYVFKHSHDNTIFKADRTIESAADTAEWYSISMWVHKFNNVAYVPNLYR